MIKLIPILAALTAPLLLSAEGTPPKNKHTTAPVAAPSLPFPPPADAAMGLAPGRFGLPEGLEVTVWAGSPLLYNPTNMDIDAAGRIWVAEGVNYRKHAGRREGGDRIVVLEDTDGDGKADKSHTFVQEKGLIAPLGVAVFDNVIVVSQPPDLIVYTDVDRDQKFDPAVDKREVLLSGFNGQNHDHSLHSVIGGPDGLWYFSQGNTGALFKDKSGKQYRIGSGYKGGGGVYFNDPLEFAGQSSDDGHVWVSGFSARMQPDGTALEVIGHGFRNSFEQVITSFGDVFQSDNDDPPACRTTFLMEHGFLGFSSLDGKRAWRADMRPGQTTPIAEWRQEDPYTIPAGDIYGGGAPTGVDFYENGALGDKWDGTLLVCETGRNTVFGYQPEEQGAGYDLEHFNFMTSNTEGKFAGSDFIGGAKSVETSTPGSNTYFRPSDVCVGADGAVYVTDWFDARTGGHQDLDETCSGTIYRIAPKGFKPTIPAIDLKTAEGQIAALKSPAKNVRWTGFSGLKARGAEALPLVRDLLHDANPYVAARAIWLLPYLGDAGVAEAKSLLQNQDARVRVAALRSLRRAGQPVLEFAKVSAGDTSPAVRREAALAMWGVPFADAKDVLLKVAEGYDGKDRSYLAALGIGATGNEAAFYDALAAKAPKDAVAWPESMARLAWRMMVPAAVPAMKARALSEKLSPEQRKLAIDALGFIRDESAAEAMVEVLAALPGTDPLRTTAIFWIENRADNEWEGFGIDQKLAAHKIDLESHAPLISVVSVEPTPEQESALDAKQILGLKGDVARGKLAAQRCVMCHKIADVGAEFGPALTGWGSGQPPEVIVEAILHPSQTIAHGYEGTHLETKDGVKIDGMVLSRGRTITMRSMGGVDQRISRKEVANETPMVRSLMMSAAQLGLQPQDVADIVAFLRAGAK